VVALGTAIGDIFNIEKLLYHKIIIATDADVDGAHIRTLLLTLFFRHFKPIVEGGYLYIAQPPLYKIKRGKEVMYVYSDEEKDAVIGKDAEIEEDTAFDPEVAAALNPDDETNEDELPEVQTKGKVQKVSIQRYKGLGEMNPDELWETTMNPSNRVLKLVNIEDAQDADKVFDILMGEDVSSRKSFIQSNAKLANLDI
jgi:DNA gyrase subunit B